MDGEVHSRPRTVLGCTSLPVACLGWELCAGQLLKSKPGLLFHPEDSFLVQGGRGKSSGLYVRRPLERSISTVCSTDNAVRCLIFLLKSFLLPASRLARWIGSLLVEHGQVLCLVEEGSCGSVPLPKGAGRHQERSQMPMCCLLGWEMCPFHLVAGSGLLGATLLKKRDLVPARKIR